MPGYVVGALVAVESPVIARLPTIVRSTEVDMLGHVNNAVYQQWFEWGRFEWVRRADLDLKALGAEGIALVVVHVAIDYKREARMDDRLDIETILTRVGRGSLRYRQRVVHTDGGVAAEGTVVLACFDTQARAAARLPPAAKAALLPLVAEAFAD